MAKSRFHGQLRGSLHRPRLSVQVLLREVRQRVHVDLPELEAGPRRLGRRGRGEPLRRSLREGLGHRLPDPARGRRTGPRRGAEARRPRRSAPCSSSARAAAGGSAGRSASTRRPGCASGARPTSTRRSPPPRPRRRRRRPSRRPRKSTGSRTATSARSPAPSASPAAPRPAAPSSAPNAAPPRARRSTAEAAARRWKGARGSARSAGRRRRREVRSCQVPIPAHRRCLGVLRSEAVKSPLQGGSKSDRRSRRAWRALWEPRSAVGWPG